MGNCVPNKSLIYNKYEYRENEKQPDNEAGPFVGYFQEDSKITFGTFKSRTFISELVERMSLHPENECYGYREYNSAKGYADKFTYLKNKEILDLSYAFARNLKLKEFCPLKKFNEEGENSAYRFLGIYSKNCVEWAITDLACQLTSVTSVTFYATLGDDAFEHVCTQTEVNTLCISGDNLSTFLKYKEKYGLNHIKTLIIFDYTLYKPDQQEIDSAVKHGISVYYFSDLLKADKDVALEISSPETIFTICYTSGTTSLPKGVKLSQKNFIAEMACLTESGVFKEPETVLSYLPLAHIMERLNTLAAIFYYGKAGFISGDVRKTLLENIEIVKPTLIIAVPRVLNLFKQKIFEEFDKLEEGCKKGLVEKGLKVKRENFKNENIIKSGFYDSLVFSKIRNKFGGRIRAFLTGSAPITKELAEDIKILFSVPLIEGYGMTETTGAMCSAIYDDLSNTSCGKISPSIRAKLVDVPELNYHSGTYLESESSPTGELCVNGPLVFEGYFRNPKATKESFDSNGWFHTGDIARIMPFSKGIKIIDRVKEIFKLSQGEYIAPSKLEGVYMQSKYVSQICIYGNSLKDHIVGLVVPNTANVLQFLKQIGRIENSKELKDFKIENYLEDKDLKEEMKKDFERLANSNNFNSLEKVRNFSLCLQEMTVENGCYTPSLKLVRRKIEQVYENEINSAYSLK